MIWQVRSHLTGVASLDGSEQQHLFYIYSGLKLLVTFLSYGDIFNIYLNPTSGRRPVIDVIVSLVEEWATPIQGHLVL